VPDRAGPPGYGKAVRLSGPATGSPVDPV